MLSSIKVEAIHIWNPVPDIKNKLAHINFFTKHLHFGAHNPQCLNLFSSSIYIPYHMYVYDSLVQSNLDWYINCNNGFLPRGNSVATMLSAKSSPSSTEGLSPVLLVRVKMLLLPLSLTLIQQLGCLCPLT